MAVLCNIDLTSLPSERTTSTTENKRYEAQSLDGGINVKRCKSFHNTTNRWHSTRIAGPVRTPITCFIPRDILLSNNPQEHIIFKSLIGPLMRGGMFVFATISKYTHHSRALWQWQGSKDYVFQCVIYSLRYPTCNAHEPYCHLWPAQL